MSNEMNLELSFELSQGFRNCDQMVLEAMMFGKRDNIVQLSQTAVRSNKHEERELSLFIKS